MKKLILLILLPFGFAFSQDITKVEYFFDEDPGFDKATNITITQGEDIAITAIPMTGLENGFHRLYVRAKDVNGDWSSTFIRSFVKTTSQAESLITKVEYFFDEDPGFDKATSITITQGEDIAITAIPMTGLENGFHRLYVRAKDVNGDWSSTFIRSFVKTTAQAESLITKVEYFIDADPGFGKAVDVPVVSKSTDVDLSFTADLTGLELGTHTIYARVADEAGNWSTVYFKAFEVVIEEETLGIDDIEMSTMLIYPSPTKGSFSIKLNEKQDNVKVIITDLHGRVVSERSYSDIEVVPESIEMASGVYIVNVICANGQVSVNKIVKE